MSFVVGFLVGFAVAAAIGLWALSTVKLWQ